MSEIITSVVTLARRVKLCKATSGAIAQLPAITHIAFGDGGVDAQGRPVTPLESQTALNHEVGRYAIDGVTYPEATTAQYTATIPKPDLTGVKLSEAGLVDGEGTLCAIKTMSVKEKDDGVLFTFVFDDKF